MTQVGSCVWKAVELYFQDHRAGKTARALIITSLVIDCVATFIGFFCIKILLLCYINLAPKLPQTQRLTPSAPPPPYSQS